MKLGLIARADNSGLGTQTWEFYRHMQPAKTMVVDISKLNGNKIHLERYPDAKVVRGIPTYSDIYDFLEGLDCVFIAEAAYNFALYNIARERGVKTAVQYNYEFFDWFIHPSSTTPRPDMLIAPSKWHYEQVNAWCEINNVKHVYLHVPVDREVLRPRPVPLARTFLHIAGRAAAHDRNGTLTVIEASRYLTTDAKIVVHFQGEQGLAHQTTMTTTDYKTYAADIGDPTKLQITTHEYPSYADVYKRGDVLLLPRRYGGNCLPMNEALSVGMPVIMTDIEPNNRFLPAEWLLPAVKISEFEPRTVVDIYGADSHALAAQIDRLYEMSEDAFNVQSTMAKGLAASISWEVMKPKYEAALEELCTQ